MTFRQSALAALFAVAAAVPLAAQAQQPSTQGVIATAPGAAMAIETTKATATIVGIDAAGRVLTLKGPEGKVFNLAAGEQVKNFDKLRVGDKVTAEYTRALTLELRKGGGGTSQRTEDTAAVRAPAGQIGGAVGRQVTVLADVVSVDAKKKTIALRGPGGNVVDLQVQDPEQIKLVKKGDQVEAVYTEALAIAVEHAKK